MIRLLKPGALLLAAAIWLPLLQLLYRPAESELPRSSGPPSPTAAALARRQLALWNDEGLRAAELARMRRHNAEWDFMGRTYLGLALANLALRDPARRAEALAALDRILDETLRLEREHGFTHFTLPYARRGAFVMQPPRSLFVDGELALLLGARRLVAERPEYRAPLAERARLIAERMRRGPVLSAESYPDECWTFCNTVALAALRIADVLEGRSEHAGLLRDWVATARRRLLHRESGLLISSYAVDGRPKDGPEGSSLWMAAHMLELVDRPFAEDQYRRGRGALYRSVLGFGYAREWPASWQGPRDIDSGPVVPLLEASPSSSGLALMAAASFEDRATLRGLLTTLDYAAFPARRPGGPGGFTPPGGAAVKAAPDSGAAVKAAPDPSHGLSYLGANGVGEAVILYALTLGPLWREVTRRAAR